MEYILIVKFPAVLLFYYITHINKQASESVQYMGTTRSHIFFFYTIAWSFQDYVKVFHLLYSIYVISYTLHEEKNGVRCNKRMKFFQRLIFHQDPQVAETD